MLKKVFIKILALFVLLIILNYVYSKWFYENDIQKYSNIINLVRNIPENADIIYIGESSNTTFRGEDIDKRTISDFIGDYFPNLNICHITKPASHAGIYKVLLKKIPQDNNAKTIIVTLNLRSFDAQWIYSNLETPLQKSLVLLKQYPPLVNRFLLSFKVYDIKTKQEREQQFKAKWRKDVFHLPFKFQFKDVIEWDYWMVTNGIKDVNGNYDKAKTELACHYIKAYAFQIDTLNNPRIKDFDHIIEYAKERNWNLVFNLLAENTEKAQKLVGNDLIYMINKNAEILKKYFRRRGVVVVDNLNCVEDELFIDQNWTTEHYAEKGRKEIAKNVAEALKLWYANSFAEVDYKNAYKTTFFNDCDKDVIWGQMQTITSEMAHSGTKSSKVGGDNKFSITMEYPLKIIPDSIKNMLRIELWYYELDTNSKAKLFVQAEGENFKYFHKSFVLDSSITNIDKWTKYTTNMSIPDSIKQADLMKVYIYNPSNKILYIDDFNINIGNKIE